MIPGAEIVDSSNDLGGWYRARGWRGGRAPGKTHTSGPTPAERSAIRAAGMSGAVRGRYRNDHARSPRANLHPESSPWSAALLAAGKLRKTRSLVTSRSRSLLERRSTSSVAHRARQPALHIQVSRPEIERVDFRPRLIDLELLQDAEPVRERGVGRHDLARCRAPPEPHRRRQRQRLHQQRAARSRPGAGPVWGLLHRGLGQHAHRTGAQVEQLACARSAHGCSRSLSVYRAARRRGTHRPAPPAAAHPNRPARRAPCRGQHPSAVPRRGRGYRARRQNTPPIARSVRRQTVANAPAWTSSMWIASPSPRSVMRHIKRVKIPPG